MAKLKFYDMRAGKSFSTEKYRTVTKSGREFAVATGPSGSSSYRILGTKKQRR
jgi:hypothetical protein